MYQIDVPMNRARCVLGITRLRLSRKRIKNHLYMSDKLPTHPLIGMGLENENKVFSRLIHHPHSMMMQALAQNHCLPLQGSAV